MTTTEVSTAPADADRSGRTPGAAVGLGLVLVAFAVVLPGAWRAIGGAMEEGFMLVFPERVLRGDVPNRDFLQLYGPGSLWVLAAAFKALGASLTAERLVGAAQLLGVILAVRAWVRPWGEVLATVAGLTAVVFAITPIGLVALPWMGGLAWVLWGSLLVVRGADAGSPRLLLAGGVLAGIGLLYRPDLVLAVALVGLVVGRSLAAAERRRALLGLALGVAPMLVQVLLAGPGNAFRGMVLDPVVHLRPGRHLPLPPSSTTLDGYLQRIAELDALRWPALLTVSEQLRWWCIAVILATAVVVAAGVAGARRRPGSARDRRLVALAALCLGILPQALQRPDSTHLAWVSCVTLAVLPVAVAELVGRADARARAIGTGVLVAAVVLVVPSFTMRPYADLLLATAGRDESAIEIEHDGRRFFVGLPPIAAAFDRLAPQVEQLTEPGDRLFVGPADLSRTAYGDTWLYHLFSDLVPATYFMEMDPGVADKPGSRLADDLATADVVLLTDTWDKWTEPNESVEHGSREPVEVLARDFCLVDEAGGMSLYRRCDP